MEGLICMRAQYEGVMRNEKRYKETTSEYSRMEIESI